MDVSADCGKDGASTVAAGHPSVLHDVHGKLATALKHKEEGTEYFKAGNYKKAISCYAKVTAFTRYDSAYLSVKTPFLKKNYETNDNLQWTTG